MLGRLIPLGGGEPLLLMKPHLVVGRGAANDIAIPDGKVSGRHCELQLQDGYWWVRDLGSRNGTCVDNVRCEHSRIAPGSVLRVAGMRYRIDYPTPANASVEDSAVAFLMEGDSRVELSLEPQPGQRVHIKLTGDDIRGDARPKAPNAVQLPLYGTPNQRVSEPGSTVFERPAAPQNRSATTMIMQAAGRLMPSSGGDPEPLLKSPMTIGRRDGCDLVLKFGDVSSRHCTLTFEEGFWVVTDDGSTNGVRVNGNRVRRQVVMPGDRLSVASRRFVVQYVAQGHDPPADDDNHLAVGLLEKLGLDEQSVSGQFSLYDKDAGPESRRIRLDD